MDYVDLWQHNGYWLFDSLEVMEEIAREGEISLEEMTPFYYEVYPLQWVEEASRWEAFSPEPSFTTDIREPPASTVEGFDVVSFYARTLPECSPLSCNNLAETLAVNEHCLFSSFAAAKGALEAGSFDGSEPGPFRIFEVRTVGVAEREIEG